jgi:hypothetical protein
MEWRKSLMSIARHHNEWLSLVPNSGPFLSLPVLVKAFPQGLPTLDLELKKETRLRFEGWEDGKKDRAVRRSWCDFVLRSVLQFPAEVAAEGQTIPPGMEARMSEFGEVLRPDVAIIPPKGANSIKPRLLVQFFHTDQDLEKPLRDKHWKASPATRMTELLHAADVPLGLITNGEHWMLVHAPRGETSGFASWYAPLWFEEPLTFQAFTTLLSAQRFFGVAETDTIEALLSRSATDQQEVTEQLGRQVRKAVAVLIQSLDKIDQDYKRQLLEGVGDKPLYDAALTVMMRSKNAACSCSAISSTTSTTPSPRCGISYRKLRTSTSRKSSTPGSMRGAACWRRSGLSTAASSTRPCACRPTAAPSSIPTGFRSSKAASPAQAGGIRPQSRSRSATAPCCTCSTRSRFCRPRCRAVARWKPAGCRSGRWTSNK